jgi:putative hydrolase of HD superfamily
MDMQHHIQPTTERVKRAHDYLLELGRISVDFAQVERAVRYPDGDRETDVEHSFHLAISALELASDFYPELDLGLVAQFCLVHDLPEVKTGDVWTFNISDEDRQKKEADEAIATKELIEQLPPHTSQLLARYEEQVEIEARFVRFVDKILPAIINIMAGDANTFKEDYGMVTAEDVYRGHEARTAKLQALFPEFQAIHMVSQLISQTSINHVFGLDRDS